MLVKFKDLNQWTFLIILIDEPIANTWKYFDWVEVTMAGEKVIISRTGFTNELGWEIYFRPENKFRKIR